jgi:tetratricopeptide (TPR) repeat protein
MSTNKLDIGGDTSSEEDEDAPIGITAPVSSSSSSSSSSADSKASNLEPPEKVIQVTKAHSAALQAAINAASAESESVLINYAAQASDLPELAHAENLVYREPYNTRAWETICGQAQSLPLDRARPLYERFLRKFPTAGRYWKYYAEHEYREGETSKADAVFERGLVNTVSSELWRCYTDFKRNVYTEEKDAHLVDVAYQRALDEIGSSFDSLGIWKDYIGWITSRLEAVNANDQFEQEVLVNYGPIMKLLKDHWCKNPIVY